MFGIIHGKIFDSSVMAEGHEVVYVFQCMITLADGDDVVDMGISALAKRIQMPLAKVEHAIHRLSLPDQDSKSADCDGKRIVSLRDLDVESNRGWFIVNREDYIRDASKEKRRNYMRNFMRQKRSNDPHHEPKNANDLSEVANKIIDVSSGLADINKDVNKNIDVNKNQASPFDRWWECFPKKVKKKTAMGIWKNKQLDSIHQELILDVKTRIKDHTPWVEGFIPHPTTYLSQERWEDEIEPYVHHKRIGAKFPSQSDHEGTKAIGLELGMKAKKGESYINYWSRLKRAHEGEN